MKNGLHKKQETDFGIEICMNKENELHFNCYIHDCLHVVSMIYGIGITMNIYK
jgi:hypothetical protein